MGDVNQALAGFQERMAKVALFDPLFELQRKKQSDGQGQSIEMMELGLLTLLFFFEQKLIRNARAGVKDLASYLGQVTNGRYQLSEEDYEDLARSVIGVFRPTSGKKRAFAFYNWETLQEDEVYTSILRASAFDSKSNTQFYALDEDGLELVFATKEFYAEFQLSIHQLVLRKQLEKGEFQGALRQINEMRVDVETLQERMVKLSHEIKRSIVSEDTLGKYSSLLDDIYIRLQRENEEFEELRDFVKETKDRIYSDTLQDKQHHAYEYILRISAELEKVHGEHTMLLQRSMQLRTGALQAAKESLYYTGMNSFNFDQDLSSLIFGSPLPLEALRGVLSPFMGLEQRPSWSLLTVFSEQNIAGDSEEDSREEEFMEAAEEDPRNEFVKQRGKLFALLMEDLILALERLSSVRLSELVETYREREDRRRLLELRAFYDFWLILHQRSPVLAGSKGEEREQVNGMEEALQRLGGRSLRVREGQGIVRASGRFSIQEMNISWGDDAGAL
ncbi:replicative DNA helicase [Paenibacillus sp. BR2-3]